MKSTSTETPGNTSSTKDFLLEEEMSGLLEMAQKAVPPTKRLRGQGAVALTLSSRGFGVRAISRFLSTHGLPVSPAAVSKFLSAERAAKDGGTASSKH